MCVTVPTRAWLRCVLVVRACVRVPGWLAPLESQCLDSYPKAQCICGATTFILQKNYNLDKKVQIKLCTCSRKNKSEHGGDCPSHGCTEYL